MERVTPKQPRVRANRGLCSSLCHKLDEWRRFGILRDRNRIYRSSGRHQSGGRTRGSFNKFSRVFELAQLQMDWLYTQLHVPQRDFTEYRGIRVRVAASKKEKSSLRPRYDYFLVIERREILSTSGPFPPSNVRFSRS